ncbi:hypothetical protein RJ035_000384 [Blastomyces gilchristii]
MNYTGSPRPPFRFRENERLSSSPQGFPFPRRSPHRCALKLPRHMISDASGGRIVLISSISAHRVNYPQPQAAYNVSKAGILQLRASLAAEWSQYGIRVNSISPGYMDTALNEGDALAPCRQIWADRNPMGRMGDPREMASPVVFLCSEVAGSYVNGADIVDDGE